MRRQRAPGELPSDARPRAPQQQAGELYQDERGAQVEAMVGVNQQQQQTSSAQRRQAAAQDVDVPSAPGGPRRNG